MEYKVARPYLLGKTTHVDPASHLEESGSSLGGRRSLEHVLVPRHLLRRALRQEQRAEHPTKRRRIGVPARTNAREHGGLLVALAAFPSTPGVAPIQYEVRHPVGMRRCKRDGDGRSLGDPEQHETVEFGRLDDGLEISDTGLEGDVGNISVRQAATTLVVSDDGVLCAERVEPWRHTGLCQSKSTWVIHVAVRTSGGPDPWTA